MKATAAPSGPATRVRDPWSATLGRQPAGWRTALLARVVALAIASGLALSDGQLADVALALGALGIVAAVACLVDLGATPPLARIVPVAEACLAAVVVTGGATTNLTLLVYLAVPPLVAGLRLGPLSVLNALLASALTVAAGGAALTEPAARADLASRATLWVGVGVAVGIIAAVQSRRMRELELLQAPYEPARRAASELYDLTRDLPGSLDAVSTARALAVAVLAAVETDGEPHGAALFLTATSTDGCPLAIVGDPSRSVSALRSAALAAQVAGDRQAMAEPGVVAVPLRAGDRTLGSVVVTTPSRWREEDLGRIQRVADEHTVQLEAALVFERIRAMASTEERNRLARDLHDGAIQEIAGLGYLMDDLVASSTDPGARAAAEQVRAELTRVIRELRHSVFDLRHGLETGDLDTALRDYADHVRRLGELQVHLASQVTGTPVPPTHEAELLRIVQEAVTNARKHARAGHVWIDYRSDGIDLLLTVDDDGVGSTHVGPRDGHFGLRTMTERARRIGAELSVEDRPGGGTRLSVRTDTAREPRLSQNRLGKITEECVQ